MESSIETIAIRLADEGVPLRAIARATKISSEVLRERLRAAKDVGTLLEVPRDDWPPGFSRDQRVLQLVRLARDHRLELASSVQRIFGMTPTEGRLLLIMLQHSILLREAVDGMSAQAIDVHICRMRQALKPFQVVILTVWGVGYTFSATARRQVMDMILRHSKDVGA